MDDFADRRRRIDEKARPDEAGNSLSCDVETRVLERSLLHTQRLENLGTLASSIAHDLNNILAGIMGYADLAKAHLPSLDLVRSDIEVIRRAVSRAADLTRQMLAHAGQGKFVVGPVNLSGIVKDICEMVKISISKKAMLKCNLACRLPTIQADASQIHQVILNLVINASDAIGENGGLIVISTDSIQYTATGCAANGRRNDPPEGRYVRLEVTDTGCGIDEPTLEKMFEPFFTTKFTGRGLGLAAVRGIVRAHRGVIRVSSKPGEGTTFQVLFPASDTTAPLSALES